MRIMGLLLVMAVGATIAVYTPLKDIYPPRHDVFAFAAETVPEIADYIPAAWMASPEQVSAEPELRSESTAADMVVKMPVEVTAQSEQQGLDIVWTEFQSDQLRALLGEMGFFAEQATGDQGEVVLLIKRATGLDFGLVLKVCEGTSPNSGCSALQVAAIVFQDMDDDVIVSMNQRHDSMKFAKLDGGDLQITRYLIADHGIARDNVRANIEAFVDILDLYMGTG